MALRDVPELERRAAEPMGLVEEANRVRVAASPYAFAPSRSRSRARQVLRLRRRRHATTRRARTGGNAASAPSLRGPSSADDPLDLRVVARDLDLAPAPLLPKSAAVAGPPRPDLHGQDAVFLEALGRAVEDAAHQIEPVRAAVEGETWLEVARPP